MKKKLLVITVGVILYFGPPFIIQYFDKSGVFIWLWFVFGWIGVIACMEYLSE